MRDVIATRSFLGRNNQGLIITCLLIPSRFLRLNSIPRLKSFCFSFVLVLNPTSIPTLLVETDLPLAECSQIWHQTYPHPPSHTLAIPALLHSAAAMPREIICAGTGSKLALFEHSLSNMKSNLQFTPQSI